MTSPEHAATFARSPGALVRLGYSGLWLGVVLGPWLALATVLHRLRLATATAAVQVRGWPLGWVLLEDPFSGEALRASLGVAVALTGALGVWAWWERRRARASRPWIEAGWVAFLGAPAWLGLGAVLLASRALSGQSLVAEIPPSAVADARAVAWTSIALYGALGLAPSFALWFVGRALRRVRGACTIGAERVRFRPPGLLPWSLELPKHQLGARTLTPRGVRVTLPQGPALLVPTASAEETEEVLRHLDDHAPPGPTPAPSARWWHVGVALAVAAPVASASGRFGPEWALPALALTLLVEAPGLALVPRRPRLGAFVLAALSGLATCAAAVPWPVYRVTRQVEDDLGNALTVIARLGDPEVYVLLGEPPAELRLPGWRTLKLPNGQPGVCVDLARGRVDGRSPATFPAAPRLLVHTAQGTWEASARPLILDGLSERPSRLPRDLQLSLVTGRLADPLLHVDEVLKRYCDGVTSTTQLSVLDYCGEELFVVVEGGTPRYAVVLPLGTLRPVFARRDGALHVVRAGRWGWQPGDPGRLLWFGRYGRGGSGALAFPGEVPRLEALKAVVARVMRGASLSKAGREVLPFWDLDPAPGLSPGTCREIGLKLREGEGYYLSFEAEEELLRSQGLGAHGLGLGTPAGTALRERIAAEALRSPVARTRCAALRTLYGAPQWLGCALVRAALADPAPEVREQALRLAAEGRFGEDWVQAALEAARADPAPDVRRVAEALLARR